MLRRLSTGDAQLVLDSGARQGLARSIGEYGGVGASVDSGKPCPELRCGALPEREDPLLASLGASGAPGARPDRIAATAGYRLSEANSVSLEALHETRPGDGEGIAARVTGNLSWGGGTDGDPRAPVDSRFRRGESPAAGDAPGAGRPAPVRLDAVAVGAFYNLSGAPADDWIGAGVTETLTSALEQLDAVEVVRNPGGSGPAAAWVVDGEYRRWGDRLQQIDTRVVDTRSGAVAARSSVEGATAEIFDLQDRITADLAGVLGKSEYGRRDRPSRAAGGGAPTAATRRGGLASREAPGRRFRSVRGRVRSSSLSGRGTSTKARKRLLASAPPRADEFARATTN